MSTKPPRVIGRCPKSHGRPTAADDYTGAPGGSVGFARTVSQEGLPRYSERNDPDAYRILKAGGNWPHTVNVDATFRKPKIADKHVTVTRIPHAAHPHGKLVITVSAKPPTVKEVKPAKARSLTKKQARGTWDPCIGSEPMLPVTESSLPCRKHTR